MSIFVYAPTTGAAEVTVAFYTDRMDEEGDGPAGEVRQTLIVPSLFLDQNLGNLFMRLRNAILTGPDEESFDEEEWNSFHIISIKRLPEVEIWTEPFHDHEKKEAAA